jgi:hypothetical protein
MSFELYLLRYSNILAYWTFTIDPLRRANLFSLLPPEEEQH